MPTRSRDVFVDNANANANANANGNGTVGLARARQPDDWFAELQRPEASCPEGVISVLTGE